MDGSSFFPRGLRAQRLSSPRRQRCRGTHDCVSHGPGRTPESEMIAKSRSFGVTRHDVRALLHQGTVESSALARDPSADETIAWDASSYAKFAIMGNARACAAPEALPRLRGRSSKYLEWARRSLNP